MAGAASSRELFRNLDTLFRCGTVGQASDAELLERFTTGESADREAAFAAIVDRHGAMVLAVCRRVLGNRHEAEDAFQATFLVLARKARTIQGRNQLASWLHGVARHVALDARARTNRRRAHEKRLISMGLSKPTDQARTETAELRNILDEELARLPERNRIPLILCELKGLSRSQAAARLGISEGTLSSRLARGKARLRDRLARRGLTLSAAALASGLAGETQAILVSPALIDSTIKVAALAAAGSSLTGVVSTSVVTLTQGVLKAMLLSKLKLGVGIASLALITGGLGVAQTPAPSSGQPASPDRLEAVEKKLDLLIEVLRASAVAPAPIAAAPRPGAAPVATQDPPLPYMLGGGKPGHVPAPPQNDPFSPAAPQKEFFSPAPARPAAARVLPPPEAEPQPSHSIDRRINALEERISQLERRLNDIDARLNRAEGGEMRRTTGPDGRPIGSKVGRADSVFGNPSSLDPSNIEEPTDLNPISDNKPAPPAQPQAAGELQR
jgi:RNA polymerase sigma factor (sigma-70 family)